MQNYDLIAKLIASLQRQMQSNEHVSPTVNDLQNMFQNTLDLSTAKMPKDRYDCFRKMIIFALKAHQESHSSYEQLIKLCIFKLQEC